MKLDRSMLPDGVSFDRKEGLFAQLGPQQQVLHLGLYSQGQLKPGTWSLDVAPDGSWARAQRAETEEWPPKKGGEDDDEENGEEPASLVSFARDWIARIAQGNRLPPPVCSFCGKTQQEVEKLIAGPSVYICNECIGLCNDIIGNETSSGE